MNVFHVAGLNAGTFETEQERALHFDIIVLGSSLSPAIVASYHLHQTEQGSRGCAARCDAMVFVLPILSPIWA